MNALLVKSISVSYINILKKISLHFKTFHFISIHFITLHCLYNFCLCFVVNDILKEFKGTKNFQKYKNFRTICKYFSVEGQVSRRILEMQVKQTDNLTTENIFHYEIAVSYWILFIWRIILLWLLQWLLFKFYVMCPCFNNIIVSQNNSLLIIYMSFN